MTERRLSQTLMPPQALEFLRTHYPTCDISNGDRVVYNARSRAALARALDRIDRQRVECPESVRAALWELHDEFEAWGRGIGDRSPAGVWWLYRASPSSRWFCRGALYLGKVVNEVIVTSAAEALRDTRHSSEGFCLSFAESSLKALDTAPEGKASPVAVGAPAQAALKALREMDPASSHDVKVLAIKRIRVPYMPFGSGRGGSPPYKGKF